VAAGGALAITGLSPPIARLLQLTGLDRAYRDSTEATEHLTTLARATNGTLGEVAQSILDEHTKPGRTRITYACGPQQPHCRRAEAVGPENPGPRHEQPPISRFYRRPDRRSTSGLIHPPPPPTTRQPTPPGEQPGSPSRGSKHAAAVVAATIASN
jgi:hypothetical protein